MTVEDLLLEEWKLASELHRHEDNLSWSRFSYFVALTGVLLPVYGGLMLQTEQGVIAPARAAAILVSIFGVVTNIAWIMMQVRSKLYHQYRVAQARAVEQRLLVNGERVLSLYESNVDRQQLFVLPKYWRLLSRVGTHNVIILFAGAVSSGWVFLFVGGILYILVTRVS